MKPDAMKVSLTKLFVPALRALGFTGSFPHFRRIRNDRIDLLIDLLTVQFDRHGGGFIIEVSKCPSNGYTTHWGKQIPPNKVRAWDLDPRQRHRLGSPTPGVDGHWFRFDDGTPTEVVANQATLLLEEADRWWNS
jgi:uncharacterized protein DUF4304